MPYHLNIYKVNKLKMADTDDMSDSKRNGTSPGASKSGHEEKTALVTTENGKETYGISKETTQNQADSSSQETTLVEDENLNQNAVGNDKVPIDEEKNEKEKDGTCCTCGSPNMFRINKDLIFYKVFFLSFFGALGSVMPYLAVYFKQMGLGPQEIGIIFGLRPLVGFISAPIWGALGDKYNIRRTLFLVSIVAWVAMIVGLGFIPTPEPLDTCPDELKPHRNPRHRRTSEHYSGPPFSMRGSADTIRLLQSNDSLTSEEVKILQEDTGWLYLPSETKRVFVTGCLLILGGELVQSATSAFADAGLLQILGPESRDDYGNQRAWGSIGWGVSSFVTGAVISSTRYMTTICDIELYFSDYRNFVYIFLVFIAIGFIAATQIVFHQKNESKSGENVELSTVTKFEKPPEAEYSLKQVLKVFLNVHYGSWMITNYCMGIFNGAIWGFLYWHLENLGATQLLMGVDGVVTCTSEFVMFFFVDRIIHKIGHIGIMYVSLFCYSIRFMVYAFLTNPWLVLPVEVLQGLTFSCLWVSMTTYSAQAVPSSSLGTIQGILHGVYFGLGTGSGKLITGLLISVQGAALTYYVFSACSILVLVLFFIAQNCSTKPEIDSFFYQDLDKETQQESKE